ncbi:MAG: hypothetical protein AB1831_05985 [Pseudomonadota bacterium]
MYSEQLAIMLFMAATQLSGPQGVPPHGPAAENPRHALIRAVREPELMAALSLRARRLDAHQGHALADRTLLASAD